MEARGRIDAPFLIMNLLKFINTTPTNLGNLGFFEDPRIVRELESSLFHTAGHVSDEHGHKRCEEVLKCVVLHGPLYLLNAFEPLFNITLTESNWLQFSLDKKYDREANQQQAAKYDEISHILLSALRRESLESASLENLLAVRILIEYFESLDQKILASRNVAIGHVYFSLCMRFGFLERYMAAYKDLLVFDKDKNRLASSFHNYLLCNRWNRSAHEISSLVSDFEDRHPGVLKRETKSLIANQFLREGRLEEARNLYKSRKSLKPKLVDLIENLGLDDWTETTRHGESILLIAEQGVGDVYVFSSFLPDFIRQYHVKNIGIITGKKSGAFLQHIFSFLQVFVQEPNVPLKIPRTFEKYLGLAELPLYVEPENKFRLTLKNQAFREQFDVCVHWRSHESTVSRQPIVVKPFFPSFEEIKDLIRSCPSTRFLIVQPDLHIWESEELLEFANVELLQDPQRFFDDLAFAVEVINNCRTCIGYSMTGYLAHSLGKPTFQWAGMRHWIEYGRGFVGAFRLFRRKYSSDQKADLVPDLISFVMKQERGSKRQETD